MFGTFDRAAMQRAEIPAPAPDERPPPDERVRKLSFTGSTSR